MSLLAPRILFVAPRYPFPTWRGDQVRTLQLVRSLSKRARVKLITFGDPEMLPMPFDGVEVRTVMRRRRDRLGPNLWQRPDLPAQVRLFLDSGMSKAITEEIVNWQPNVLHVTLARMGPYMPRNAPFHRHLDLIDSLGLNMGTRAETGRGPVRSGFQLESKLMQSYEARIVASADTSSVVSEADRQMPGLSEAEVIPNGVDAESYPFSAPDSGPPELMFFGNLGYFHNIEPARFLAEEVMPLVRRRIPDARLRLVGARPAQAVQRLSSLPGVELAANVSDMAEELGRASVAVLPSFSGSGIKNKVLEAFCAGLPVVSNRLGIQGVEGARAGEHYVPAEDRETTADAAVEALSNVDLRGRIAHSARDLVLDRYSWDRQADRLLGLYSNQGALV